jgi:hypothetical protein
MKIKEKRKTRTYKVADKYYFKAKNKFKKSDSSLAQLLEEIVIAKSKGLEVMIMVTMKENYSSKSNKTPTHGK